MRTTTNQFRSGAAALAFMALAAIVTTFSACQSTEEGLDAHPQGSIPLVVGTVTVGTPATVGTRVAITEGATGHTGIRKTRFVEGNQIELQVSDAAGGSSHTITLDGKGNWNFDRPAYVLPNSTMFATYTSAEQQAGIPADNLSATTAADGGITLTGGTLTLGLKHVGAMIDVIPVSGGAAITSVTLNGNIATVAEEEDAQTMHYRTIVAAGSTSAAISTITAEINGIKYVATLATPITPGANKCHPINLTFKNGTLTATASAPQNWTDGGEINAGGAPDPTTYDRIIDTPEALAQFANDVNVDAGVRTEKVLQTANIDMSQLKTAGDANTAEGVTSYTYTATADNWVPIGTDQNAAFKGSYNGNGYTISDMKTTTYPPSTGSYLGQGFFGAVGTGAQLTGIHLRNFKAVESTQTFGSYAGALAGYVDGATVSLCSATGELQGKAVSYSYIGGLIGYSASSCITRCTSRVNVTVTSTTSNNWIGGFAGTLRATVAVSCSSVSDLNVAGEGSVGGFCGIPFTAEKSTIILGCYAGGTIVGSGGGAFGGIIDNRNKMTLESCYSNVTGDNISDFIGSATDGFDKHVIRDCAWAGAEPSPKVFPITYGIAPAAAYAAVTAITVNSTNVTTLHWSAADGYTLTPVTDKTWNATGIWKDNGSALPTINLAYEGE